MNTETTATPEPLSTLEKINGTWYVQTALRCPSLADIRAWWVANHKRVNALGGMVRKSSGTMYRQILRGEYAQETWSEIRVVWPVADQAAAARFNTDELMGVYASNAAKYRSDLRNLTPLATA